MVLRASSFSATRLFMSSFSRILFAFGACFALLLTRAAASDDVRLSRTLVPDEFAAAGLSLLSTDQIAVLDALVRRDIADSARVTRTKEARPARFSERLTADERKNAGLTAITPEQLAQLDNFVARLSSPEVGGTGQFVSRDTGRTEILSSRSLRRAPEIHGSISLMYGAGSGGYSERGGAMTLSYEDPSGLSIAVGYAETHSKGGYYRDYCRRGFRDPFGLTPW